MIAIIATAIACFVVGGILSYVLFRYVLKSKYDSVLKDAETEAEVIKKNNRGSNCRSDKIEKGTKQPKHQTNNRNT